MKNCHNCSHPAENHRLMATVYTHERVCLLPDCDCGGYESGEGDYLSPAYQEVQRAALARPKP